MSTIAQLNHTECPKLHTLITTKFKLLNNLNMANITKGIWRYVDRNKRHTSKFRVSHCGVAVCLCLIRCDAVSLG